MDTPLRGLLRRSLVLAFSFSILGGGCAPSDSDGSTDASGGSGGEAGGPGGAGGGTGGVGGGTGGVGGGTGGVGGGTGGVGGGTGGVGGGTGGEGGGTGGVGGGATSPGTHFAATSVEWSLPADSPDPEGFYAISNVKWTTMDLDGDGKPDLVVTAGATDSNPRWLFYKNTGSGFSATATDWSLPAESPTSEGFWTFANYYWNTTDLDGDGKPDLVVTGGASDGNRRWLVYKNTGSGFAKTATKWTLPGNAPDFVGFSDIYSDTWTTMDLDGDGRPDLVVTNSATEADRRWLVYTNTGSGFATTATDWSLPAGSPNSNGFFTRVHFYWTTMDLDGDGKPDLVVHFDTSRDNPLWLVYENTGHGFAETATEWSLPEDSPTPEGFHAVVGDYWTTMDLDGDGKPDLVVNGGASEDNRRWLLFKNTGSSFVETALEWSLPAGSPDPFGYHSLASNDWTTMDLDGDGKPDLVVSYGASESNRRWLLYKNTP